MNKSQLVDSVVQDTGLSKKQAQLAVHGLINSIIQSLTAKEKVTLIGFGTFDTVTRAARTGRNPRTGKEVKIAATVNPKFKPGQAFKDAIAAATTASAKPTKDKPAKEVVSKSKDKAKKK